MSVKIPSLLFQGKRRIDLVDWPFDDSPPAAGQAIGRTVLTLVSPGTEVTGAFERDRKEPAIGGYAAIIDVEQVGPEVTNIKPGDRVFGLGQYKAKMRFAANQAVKVPDGVAPEVAVVTRLAGVSWTTLTTTGARPADRVVIVGLGIIGNLAAQIFSAAGYRVTAALAGAGVRSAAPDLPPLRHHPQRLGVEPAVAGSGFHRRQFGEQFHVRDGVAWRWADLHERFGASRITGGCAAGI
jgi:threonine dehydrogenase-like Zn-dependent dehydrogenase